MRGLTASLGAKKFLLTLAFAVPCLAQKVDNRIVFSPKADASRVLPESSAAQSAPSSRPQSKYLQAKFNPASTTQGHSYGDPPFIVSATSESPGVVTYSLVSGKATVTSAGLVTLTGVGSVTVEAMQAATTNYTSATQTATFAVSPGTPAITFNVPNVVSTAPFAVAASSSSTGAFSYSVVSGAAKITGNMVSFTANGYVVLKASQAADANYNAASATASFLVGTPTLTVTATNASRPYGAQNPAFSGSIAGAAPNDTFLETFNTTASAASAPGTYTVIPVVSGTSLSNYAVNTVNGTLTISQAPTVTTLSANSTTINPNQTLSLTAQVTSTTTGVPSGSATFFDNGATLQTVPLVNGSASVTTPLSPGATHLFTARSSGDIDFLASPQSSGLSVTATPRDFAFTTQGAVTESSTPGKMAAYTFNVSPLFGSFAAPVTFNVLGLPSGATAAFTPATLAPDVGPSTVQLYIQIAPQTASKHQAPDTPSDRGITFATLVLLASTGSRKLRLRLGGRLLQIVLVGCGLCGTIFLTGCGSGVLKQDAGTYTLSVVATSGSLQHTQNVTWNMQ